MKNVRRASECAACSSPSASDRHGRRPRREGLAHHRQARAQRRRPVARRPGAPKTTTSGSLVLSLGSRSRLGTASAHRCTVRVRSGPRAERLRWFQVKDLMRAIVTRDAEQAEMREAMRAKVWLPRAVPRLPA